MRRLLKALPLTLAIASLCLLGIFAASCGSNNTQARLVDAISDGPALDVDVNGTRVFTDILFSTPVQPLPPAYSSVPSGTVTLQAVNTGGTTPYINSVNTTLNGSAQYTIVMTGFNSGTQGAAPTFWTVSDNNTAPVVGNVEFRIINAATNSLPLSGGLDIYIVQPGQQINTPAVSGLTLGQGSAYISENFNTLGYTFYVTPHGNQNVRFNITYQSPTGSIRTLVIVDSGNAIANFIELNDLL